MQISKIRNEKKRSKKTWITLFIIIRIIKIVILVSSSYSVDCIFCIKNIFKEKYFKFIFDDKKFTDSFDLVQFNNKIYLFLLIYKTGLEPNFLFPRGFKINWKFNLFFRLKFKKYIKFSAHFLNLFNYSSGSQTFLTHGTKNH